MTVDDHIFFAQRDTIINFQLDKGLGTQIGTVEGHVTGTSIVNFQFTPTSPTENTFENRVLITDLDGDQMLFKNPGRTKFLASLTDPSSPLGNLMGLDAVLTGTYLCLKASGKWQHLVGRTFPYRATGAISTTPGPGQVYVEVYWDGMKTDLPS